MSERSRGWNCFTVPNFVEIASTVAEISRFFDISRWRPPPSWFSKFKFFNGWNGQEGQTASLCQISSKSIQPQPRYVSFNIMLVGLENAFSHPYLGLFCYTFPQMMSLIVLTPKRTIFGLNHVIWATNCKYFPIDFLMGLRSPLFPIPDIIYTTLCKMQQIYYIHNVVQMQLISYARFFLELRIFSKVLCIQHFTKNS